MSIFSLIGAGGYIAPRHMRAIRDTGNSLVSAVDKSDSVGILDSFFPEALFFTDFERFAEDLSNQETSKKKVDFISITSPNHLHLSHLSFALRSNCDAICEKPLVLVPEDLDTIIQLENETGRNVNAILQLRLHPAIQKLKQDLDLVADKKSEVDLTYITSRGNWYSESWKGDTKKSGGIATNIGVHFFDMLHFLFGSSVENQVHLSEQNRAAGYLELERARVRWFLSLDKDDVPDLERNKGKTTYRSIKANEEEIEFSGGFDDLHTHSYQQILKGQGFSADTTRAAIETVAKIRHAPVKPHASLSHPFLEKYS